MQPKAVEKTAKTRLRNKFAQQKKKKTFRKLSYSANCFFCPLNCKRRRVRTAAHIHAFFIIVSDTTPIQDVATRVQVTSPRSLSHALALAISPDPAATCTHHCHLSPGISGFRVLEPFLDWLLASIIIQKAFVV